MTECSTLCFSLISRYCWRKHSNTTGLNLTQNFSGFAVSTYTDTLLVYMKCVVLTQKVMHSGERNVELALHSIQAMYNEDSWPPQLLNYIFFFSAHSSEQQLPLMCTAQGCPWRLVKSRPYFTKFPPFYNLTLPHTAEPADAQYRLTFYALPYILSNSVVVGRLNS